MFEPQSWMQQDQADPAESARSALLQDVLPPGRINTAQVERPLPEAILAQGSTFATPHDQLDRLAQATMKPKELKRFRENMQQFEARATNGNLPASEVTNTYDNVSRLLSASGQLAVGPDQRIRLAQQILDQAARVKEIDQGSHQTCSVSTVENRMYQLKPSAASKVVVDIALTGSFVTKDGTRITLPAGSLDPDNEARMNPTPDRLRSHASQLLQIAAVNAHWNRSYFSPDGRLVPRGAIQYEQHNNRRNARDTGERLMDYSSNPPKELARQPMLGVGRLVDIYNQMAHESDSGFVVEHQRRSGSGSQTVDSEQRLRSVLSASNANFPIIVRVHTGNDPFASDSGARTAQSAGVWHAVNILEYDATRGRVLIDNQWGKSGDRWVNVRTLYRAMLDPTDKADVITPQPRREPEAILHTR